MGDSNLSRVMGKDSATVKDTGYTKLCSMCGIRHGVSPHLIGLERPLKIEDCEACKKKPRAYNKYDYAVVSRTGASE